MRQRILSRKEIKRTALAKRTTDIVILAENYLEEINKELKAGIKTSRGKPLVLSSHNLSLLLVNLTLGGSDEDAYIAAQIGKTTFYKYMQQSITFANIIKHAKHYHRSAAMRALDYKLQLELSHWEEVYDPRTKKYKVKFIKRKEPSDKFLMWALSKLAPEEFGDCKRRYY